MSKIHPSLYVCMYVCMYVCRLLRIHLRAYINIQLSIYLRMYVSIVYNPLSGYEPTLPHPLILPSHHVTSYLQIRQRELSRGGVDGKHQPQHLLGQHRQQPHAHQTHQTAQNQSLAHTVLKKKIIHHLLHTYTHTHRYLNLVTLRTLLYIRDQCIHTYA
jgi:hypothetical protein